MAQVKEYSCLDEARLANVWNLVKLAGDGIFVEVGSFLGGTALHICNAMDDSHHAGARFYSFDPFEQGGFESIGPDETKFRIDSFTETNYAAVVRRLSAKPNAQVVQGFFPQAAEPFDLRNIAFCHLDVDLYEANLKCLNYLAPRLAPRSLILVDDLGQVETPGVRNSDPSFPGAEPVVLVNRTVSVPRSAPASSSVVTRRVKKRYRIKIRAKVTFRPPFAGNLIQADKTRLPSPPSQVV